MLKKFEMVTTFVKKLPILCSSVYPILFKFYQLVVKVFMKELINVTRLKTAVDMARPNSL